MKLYLVLIFLTFATLVGATTSVKLTANCTSVQLNPFGTCYAISNSTSKQVFVPMKSSSEFSRFISNLPSGVTKSSCEDNINCIGGWGSCSVSCGGGTQTYSIATAQSGTGTSCSYANGATQSCNTTACSANTNCVGGWGSCSASCGGGSQTYSITTAQSGTGTSCSYANGASQTCNTAACPVNCVGSWGSWGSCSAACGGGTQTRTYSITTPASGGGTACSATNGATGSQSCNTAACNLWANWSGRACSVSGSIGCCGGSCSGLTYNHVSSNGVDGWALMGNCSGGTWNFTCISTSIDGAGNAICTTSTGQISISNSGYLSGSVPFACQL